MQRATFGERFVAALIDDGVLVVQLAVFRVLLGRTGLLLGVLVAAAWFTWFEGGPSGQTPGKRLMHIRVIDIGTDEPIGHARAFVRFIGRVVGLAVAGIGSLWMLWDHEHQAWQDKLANSAVVPTSAYPVASWP